VTRGQENECYFDLQTEWISCGEYTCQLVESGTHYDCGEGCRISGTGGSSQEYEYYYNEWWEDWDVVEWMIADFELQCTVMNCSDPEIPQAWEEYCNEAPPPPSGPELECSGVYRGEWVECILDVAGVVEVDHVVWLWQPDSGVVLDAVLDTLEATVWQGIGAMSGTVTATAFNAGGDSVGPLSAPLTVYSRPWSAPSNFVEYQAGAAPDCFADIPRPGSSGITWGWAVGPSSCAANDLMSPSASDTSNPGIALGSGPNAGVYLVDTVVARMVVRSQILQALRPGSSDRFPVTGPQALRNACKTALGSPGGVTDTVTIEYANSDCISNADFEDATEYLWDHEHEHATEAEDAVDALGDPYATIESVIGMSATTVRTTARNALLTLNSDAVVASLALDQSPGPSFDIWLPRTNGTWDNPSSQLIAARTLSNLEVAIQPRVLGQLQNPSIALERRYAEARDAVAVRGPSKRNGRIE
jgi:hypothetical protein